VEDKNHLSEEAKNSSGGRVESPRSAPEAGMVWSWQFDPLEPERGVEIAYGGKACAVTPTLTNADLLVERLNGYDELREIVQLLEEWVSAKSEYFRFGRDEYARKASPLYAKEHNLSADDAANLQAEVREQLKRLADAEHKAEWALYEKVKQ